MAWYGMLWDGWDGVGRYADEMGQYGKGRTGKDGTGMDGTVWDGVGRDGTGRDGTGRDGLWDGTGRTNRLVSNSINMHPSDHKSTLGV
jgi:hypothetical protein